VAAEKLGEPVSGLPVKAGRIVSDGDPDASLSLAELALLAGGELTGTGGHTAPATPFDDTTVAGTAIGAFNDPSFSTHACKASVGEVQLERYVGVQDVGPVINPMYAASQVSGAVQGIGQAMFEELSYRDCRVANPNFTDYKLPTIADVPPVETILVERAWQHGPYGAKGVGEPSIIPAAPAIANAVTDAVGSGSTASPSPGNACSRRWTADSVPGRARWQAPQAPRWFN
jgi:CO/xanthine dehydrogenase Mo-binding subunit